MRAVKLFGSLYTGIVKEPHDVVALVTSVLFPERYLEEKDPKNPERTRRQAHQEARCLFLTRPAPF
jgi:hypothetical protein